MKALILNSGLGSRMGAETSEHPKCMTALITGETILSRQLNQLMRAGIDEVVITTGPFGDAIKQYCLGLELPMQFTFIKNPIFDKTNYIYSIYCARECLQDDILLMHGDLVFVDEVLKRIIESPVSCMKVSSTLSLPDKDFKAVVNNGMVMCVGIEFFDNAMEAQALYKLQKEDWLVWLDKIVEYCENGKTRVYAENALNELNGTANIHALDVGDLLCSEIDNLEDLNSINERMKLLV